MDEKKYSNNKYLSWIDIPFEHIYRMVGPLVCIGICIVLFLMILDLSSTRDYSYVYIIRRNNNTDFDFYGTKRTICLATYFREFPMRIPDIGYEYVDNLSPGYEQLYTLQKLKLELDITVHLLDSFNYDGIKYDVHANRMVIIAWDYNNIPLLAKSLGCKNCNSWNSNSASNITDNSLFDITWVLRFGKCGKPIFKKCSNTFDFYSISQNLKGSVISMNSPPPDHASSDEIINNYDCNYNNGYDIKKLK